MRQEFNHKEYDFSKFDAVVIDDALFTTDLLHTLTRYQNLKVISISSIFVNSKMGKALDGELSRPLTAIQLQERFAHIFKKEDAQTKRSTKTSLPVHREKFAETPHVTLESFADFAGNSILVVEDNYINQKVLLSVLKYSKMDIDVADNGLEALKMVQKKHYDLVLMDINMPVLDGYSATLEIRKMNFDSLPIVALSALTSTDEINRMFEVGMNGYLAKPFYKERLYTVFDMFVKKQPQTKTKKHTKQKEIHFESLNIQKGLQNSKNSELFYKEVLQEFQDAFGECDILFEKLVYDFRYEQVRMLMVDIRGLSGAIGAMQLHEISIEVLQLILFKKYELLDEEVKKFKKEMQRLNNEITLYLQKENE
jgi:CheY-like chemotaxis protein